MSYDAKKARMQLGSELRKARGAAGLTQERVAAALGCKQPKVNKIETGPGVISSKDIDVLVRVLAPPTHVVERIRLLHRRASTGPSANTPTNRQYDRLKEDEREAVEVLAFQAERLSNLLQSEHYVVEQYARAGELDDVERILDGRAEREALFLIPRPPRYRVVLSVSAFYRMPGGRRSLAVDQIEHVLRMTETHKKHLSVQVLPWEADVPYIPHDHIVLRFNDPEKKDWVYEERGEGEARIITGMKPVAAYIGYWQKASAAALSVEDTRTFLEKDLLVEARGWAR